MYFRRPADSSARAECSSAKLPYHNERTARQAATQSERERGVRLNIYQCRECLQWHLTSTIL